MKRRNVVLLATVALSLLLAACGTSTPTGNTPPPSTGVTIPADMLEHSGNLWFIELAAEPTSELGSLSLVTSQQQEFRTLAAQAGVQFEERFAFQTLFNGFSIELANQADIFMLAQLPNVIGIYPVTTIEIPETRVLNDPNMATAVQMTGADIARNELGLSGVGVRVAVMDTGIDYNHPDLGGGFGPGFRVFTGFDFVGDAYQAGAVPMPNPDPMDCNGHGTHVAGIIGANSADPNGVIGVAPNVTFGAYKVFGCQGSTTADIMIAAMEMALADGMHVLNMSIGSAFSWPNFPTATAASRLVAQGMVVVASIGNSGTSGLYAAGAPGLGRNVIGVASFDNTHVALRGARLDDGTSIGYADMAAAPEAPNEGSLPMMRTGTSTSDADACSALPAGSLTGHIALIRRGTCTFHIKALNAQNAGAAAVVIYNNTRGRFSSTVAGTPAITIPVVSISFDEGLLIDSRLQQGPVTWTWTAEEGSFETGTGNLISSFSSYGLSPDLELKPDIGAPGGLIRSTYPLALGAYTTISGTSMSAPHVAGAAAIVLEGRPNTPATQMRAILQNSAVPQLWTGDPAAGVLDMVHRQGAGMVNVPNAVLYTSVVNPAKISLGESEMGPQTTTLTIRNRSNRAMWYSITHFPALASTGIRNPGISLDVASAQISAGDIVIPARGSATVDVTITAHPSLPQNGIYGGYIVVNSSDGEFMRVPYAGFKGDYQAIRVLEPTANNFPVLARINEQGSFTLLRNGGVFTMQGGDIPFILAHFAHQSRSMEIRIFEAATNRPRRFADDRLNFLPRNSTATGFFSFPWDGSSLRLSDGDVQELPNGEYILEMRVLKALGDPNNPAHTEVWRSPIITIARPLATP